MTAWFTFLIALQFAVTIVHDLIDIPGWVHGSQVQAVLGRRKLWLATAINGIFPGIAVAFALYFWRQPKPWFVPDYWLVYCSIAVLSAIAMWYIPYFRGEGDRHKDEYNAMYAGTRHILPPRGGNRRPNLFHIGLHMLFAVNLCLAILLWLKRS